VAVADETERRPAPAVLLLTGEANYTSLNRCVGWRAVAAAPGLRAARSGMRMHDRAAVFDRISGLSHASTKSAGRRAPTMLRAEERCSVEMRPTGRRPSSGSPCQKTYAGLTQRKSRLVTPTAVDGVKLLVLVVTMEPTIGIEPMTC
jgi:hypothetical protein